MQNSKSFFVVIAILLVASIFFGIKSFSQGRELSRYRDAIQSQNDNAKTIQFTKLFVEDVLKADGEVGFETRLKLENAVRDLNDPVILAEWQKLVGSKTEAEAQIETKNLLDMLVGKMHP